MQEPLTLDELDSLTPEQAFRALFQSPSGTPPALFEPGRHLARAAESTRSADQRVTELAVMSRETEAVFRNYLSPLSVDGGPPDAASSAWPIALARWTEFLHRRALLLLEDEILPELAQQGFRLLSIAEAEAETLYADWIHEHFHEQIYPLLTPLAVDPGRPFPYISSDSLNLLVELRGGVRHEPAALFARLKIPSITPRLIWLPPQSEFPVRHGHLPPPASLIWSADLVRHHVADLFVGLSIRRVHCFRVLRAPDEQAAPQQPGEAIRGRKARGSVVRVDVDSAMPPALFDWLVDHLDVISYSVVRYESPDTGMSLPQLARAVHTWAH